MDIYNGNVTTDGNGTAVVTMPDWFEALNSQFTVIGQFAQAIIAAKMANGISWQVTGIRQDANRVSPKSLTRGGNGPRRRRPSRKPQQPSK